MATGELELRICRTCGKQFVWYNDMAYGDKPTHCPSCADKLQKRPSVVVERKMLRQWRGVKIESLPKKGQWQEFQTGYKSDKPVWKLDIKGKEFGARWSGRIVIYAHEPYKPGDVIDIREMVAKHEVKVIRWRRPTIHGSWVTEEQEIPLTEEPEVREDQEVATVVNSRPYLVFERPTEQHEDLELHWVQRYSKTTLKGFGAQYWYTINSDAAIAAWRVYGGARSGRFNTTGVLAITAPGHPVIVQGFGEAKDEDVYIGSDKTRLDILDEVVGEENKVD